MFRVLDVAAAGELVAPLSMLAAALPVPLSRDHRVARSGLPDFSRRQTQVDARETVLDAFGVVLDPPRMEKHRGRRGPPHPSGFFDRVGGNAGDLSRPLRRIPGDGLSHGLEAARVIRDELRVDPAP